MSINEKTASAHMEEKPASALEKGYNEDQQLERVNTVDIDNYHGIDLRTVLVYIVRTLPGRSMRMTLTARRLSASSTLYNSSTLLDRVQ